MLCHADVEGEVEGMVAPQPLRLLAPGQLYLSSKQFTVSCQSRCVMGVRMRRDARSPRGRKGGGHYTSAIRFTVKDSLSGLSTICPTSVDLFSYSKEMLIRLKTLDI